MIQELCLSECSLWWQKSWWSNSIQKMVVVLWDQLTFRCLTPQSSFLLVNYFVWTILFELFACCTDCAFSAGKIHAVVTTIHITLFEFHILECQGIAFHSTNTNKNSLSLQYLKLYKHISLLGNDKKICILIFFCWKIMFLICC